LQLAFSHSANILHYIVILDSNSNQMPGKRVACTALVLLHLLYWQCTVDAGLVGDMYTPWLLRVPPAVAEFGDFRDAVDTTFFHRAGARSLATSHAAAAAAAVAATPADTGSDATTSRGVPGSEEVGPDGVASAAAEAAADAVRQFERAASLDPSSVAAHHNLAVALMAAGRLREAEQAAVSARALAPHNRMARFVLEQVHERQTVAAAVAAAVQGGGSGGGGGERAGSRTSGGSHVGSARLLGDALWCRDFSGKRLAQTGIKSCAAAARAGACTAPSTTAGADAEVTGGGAPPPTSVARWYCRSSCGLCGANATETLAAGWSTAALMPAEAALDLGDSRCDVDRVDAATLTAVQFSELYVVPRRPVVLTGLMGGWKAWDWIAALEDTGAGAGTGMQTSTPRAGAGAGAGV
jgi:hypothetical protein